MRHVGLILEDGFQLMGLAALSAFELANTELGDKGYRLTVLSEKGGTVRSSMNAGIETAPLGVIPDTLMVAGQLAPQDISPGLRAYLARAGEQARRVAGVCTGAFVLAHAVCLTAVPPPRTGRMRRRFGRAFRRSGSKRTEFSSVTATSGRRRECHRPST